MWPRLRPSLLKEACRPGPELLGSGKVIVSAPVYTRHVQGRLQTSPGTANHFLELTVRLPISSLHWQPAQAALRPGSWSPAL